jgi:hypothetical protein
MKTLNGNKTNLDVIAACDKVLAEYKAGDATPAYNGVEFDGAGKLGHCQQNVRELVEAVAYGKERMWGEASCCATSTQQRLGRDGWVSVGLANAQPGDVVYFGPGGGHCSTCGQDPGHVGILHDQAESGVWNMWQNTSYDSLGLCCIPIRQAQHDRIIAVYRLFPLATAATPDGEMLINWWGTYLPADAVEYTDGGHMINLRKAAEAEGSVVKVSGGKVFVGPAAWWPE